MVRLLSLAFGSVLLMAALAAVFSRQTPPDTAAPAAARASQDQGQATMELLSDGSGRFHLEALVNGEEARFLVDTGADTIALTTQDAARFGIYLQPEDFQQVVETASGPGSGAAVRIDRMSIAGQDFRDIDAMVIQGLPVNLLGRSLISRLGTLEIHGDRILLKRS